MALRLCNYINLVAIVTYVEHDNLAYHRAGKKPRPLMGPNIKTITRKVKISSVDKEIHLQLVETIPLL